MTSSWSRITDSSSRSIVQVCWCFSIVLFQRKSEGSCLQTTCSVGSWREKSVCPSPTNWTALCLGNLISHLLSPGLCRMLLSPRTGGLALRQPLICQSDQLGDEQRNRTVLMTHSLFHIIFLSTVWRCVSVSCCPPEVPVPPAPPVLWDVCVETAPSQQGGCSRLLGWSRPSDVLHNAAVTQTVQTVCVTDYMYSGIQITLHNNQLDGL